MQVLAFVESSPGDSDLGQDPEAVTCHTGKGHSCWDRTSALGGVAIGAEAWRELGDEWES